MSRKLITSSVLFLLFAVSAFSQPISLDTVIQRLSATYDKITSYSADAEIYKYYCT
ncbi:MAG TPA: hypothetical protein VLX68_04255 [Chitinivibrionales bacterium]|nr:hypothetical protein [Chitinivibrionales bacterium]